MSLTQRVAVLLSVLAVTASPVRVDLTLPLDVARQVAVVAASGVPGDALFDDDGSTTEQRLAHRPRTSPWPVQAEEYGWFSAEETEMVLRFGGGLSCDCNGFASLRAQRGDPTGLRGTDVMSRGPPGHLREQPDRPAGAPIALLSSFPSSS